MKSLQINNNHRIVGGSDIMYLNTGSLLEKAGHEVRYFAARSSSDLKCQDDVFFPEGVDTAAAGAKDILRYFYNVGARKSINALLDTHSNIDIAHLHIYYGRLTPAILSPLRHRGIPIVQSLHEYKLACPVYTLESRDAVCEACVDGSTLNCLRKRCKDRSIVKSSMLWMEHHSSRLQGDVRLINKFICVSHFQRAILARAGIPDEKMTTLHNFVDSDALQPAGPVVREDYLFYFGRIESLKGLSTLIEAAELTGATLKIAGAGSWSEELRTRIARLPKVEYLEFVSGEPLRRLVAQAKAVIVPSEWYETFGLTALEAKAVGTPVIASDIGGLTEIVQHGRDGLLFKPGDAKALAGAIGELDNHDLEVLGAVGKQDAIDRFSPTAYLNQLLTIYSEMQPG